MKIIFLVCLLSLIYIQSVLAAGLETKLSGRILLQVQSRGEAWYINPINKKKYKLGNPTEALTTMQNLSFGITNLNLQKIPVGIINTGATDSDKDGLSDDLEKSLKTNPNDKDSDKDGYDDLTELKNNYDPLCDIKYKLLMDSNFIKQNLGKIFLQIESKGEVWYINPIDKKRYFLNTPKDISAIIKKFGLGITNKNLNKIPTGSTTDAKLTQTKATTTIIQQPIAQVTSSSTIMEQAAIAIRDNDKTTAKSLFSPNLEKRIEYTLNYFNAENRFMLSNILFGATLAISTNDQQIYSNKVFFSLGGYEVPVKFYVQKQTDGKWLIMNL